jgi:microcystin-dependent protein
MKKNIYYLYMKLILFFSFILINLVVILFFLYNNLNTSVTEIKNSINPGFTNPGFTNPPIDLSNYYNKLEIDNNMERLEDLVSNIDTDSSGNNIRIVAPEELGYEIDFDGSIIFNSPVNFKQNIDFDNPVDFNNHVDFRENVDFHKNIKINHDHNNLINTLPPRTIIAWNEDRFPRGWALCDGRSYILDSNGDAQVVSSDGNLGALKTPDLRGRFILGAGHGNNLTDRVWRPGSSQLARGGNETITINNSNLPKHRHIYKQRNGYNSMNWKGSQWDSHGGQGLWAGGGDEVDKTTGYAGHRESTAINIMPPYYILTYIMKL